MAEWNKGESCHCFLLAHYLHNIWLRDVNSTAFLKTTGRQHMKTQGLKKQANFSGNWSGRVFQIQIQQETKAWPEPGVSLHPNLWAPILRKWTTSGKRLAGKRAWERSWDSRGQQSFPTQVCICKACGRKSWAQQAEICCLLWLRHKSMPLTPGHFMQDPCLYILPPSKWHGF